MTILWKIDVISNDNKRSEKLLCCKTELIDDPVIRAQLDFVSHLGYQQNRKIIRFRSQFALGDYDPTADVIQTLFVDDYWEDPDGNRISKIDAHARLFGVPRESLILASTAPHYIKFQISVANGVPPFGQEPIVFTKEQQYVIRHFTTDAILLNRCKYLHHQEGYSNFASAERLSSKHRVDEQKAHFVSVFRRTFAVKEHASWQKFCDAVYCSVGKSPFGAWIVGERQVVSQFLSEKCKLWAFGDRVGTFNNGQLVNNFLYGKFLHQPAAADEANRASWAHEFGGEAQLESIFFQALMTISCHFVNWCGWSRHLCKIASVDLDHDSAGAKTTLMGMLPDAPELNLSPDNQKHFEACSLELMCQLRDKDPNINQQPAKFYYQAAIKYLREMI